MMAASVPPKPTQAELAILNVLWEKGPSTVRAVFDVLTETQAIGYTTVLKLMQIMAKKGLVRRDERQKTHVYDAAIAEEGTQRQLVKDLLERAFGGSAERLVMHALEEKKVTPDELSRIRRMLDDMEERKQ